MTTNPRHDGPPLLELKGLSKSYSTGGPFQAGRRVVAAEDVGFSIRRGEAVALVGESGSGKSTIARLLLRLEPADAGEARLEGVDVFRSEPRRASHAFRARVQMVFQDPFGSLNPAHDVLHHLMRPLLRLRHPDPARGLGARTRDEARARALELLHVVGLEPAGEFLHRHPYELSGGQRQRVAIARALAADPELLVADEPTSMLDVSIRMGILNLLAQLKRDRHLAILLITHDLASARFLAGRIVVLYRGRIVEDGPAAAVVDAPAHPYTRALLASIAGADALEEPRAPERPATRSERGCPFADRCPDVHEPCRIEDPAPREHDGRRIRCHLYPAAPGAGPRT